MRDGYTKFWLRLHNPNYVIALLWFNRHVPQDDFLKYEASGIAALLRMRSLGVPFYQRSYSWRTTDHMETEISSGDDKLQVVDYWHDLEASFDNKVSYFLGTIVLARAGEAGRESVIDGQQRLATTSLLLAAIRDRFERDGAEEYGNSTQQDYLGKFDRRVGADRPKLILNTDDRDFYERRVVLKEDVGATNFSQRLLSHAYDYLRDRIDEFASRHGSAWRDKLNELVDWLDASVQIVAIDVATEADAFLIFETLNDRGADLTVADLLKNYLFSQAGLPPPLPTNPPALLRAISLPDTSASGRGLTTQVRGMPGDPCAPAVSLDKENRRQDKDSTNRVSTVSG